MKVADLFNEHGLKWFKGSNILFGFLWGIFGSLLILGDNIVANIILAMNIAFIIRNRLDYLNHQLATSIIIISFLFTAEFNPIIFSIFFSIFLIFGALKDHFDDTLTNKRHRKRDTLYYIIELMPYYTIPTFIYSLIANNWIVFYVFLLYTVAYNLTKYFAHKTNSTLSL
jgi:predicted CDP-diglyceride synthetase/phosphatidate cytidylyltransferase